MLSPQNYLNHLQKNHHISFFTGVPDSLLKDFCQIVQEQAKNHYICANEGNAVAMGVGYHLATGEIPFIYMQNSGFSNALNPILSIASQLIYQIPMLIMIGWRGEPGVKDEPQHLHQGEVMLANLESHKLDFTILPSDEKSACEITSTIIADLKNNPRPYILLVTKNTFNSYETTQLSQNDYQLNRPDLIEKLIIRFSDNKFFASTGYIGRELFAAREKFQSSHSNDFLSIGAMGHVNQMAYAYCLSTKNKTIILDGDGACLMHMGGMSSIQHFNHLPLIHLVFNNACHLSVGGQPTVANKIDFAAIAKSFGYQQSFTIKTDQEFEELLAHIQTSTNSIFANIMVSKSFDAKIMRPNLTPLQMKNLFMKKGQA
jgi:phosphonopyruvate decarboxylase